MIGKLAEYIDKESFLKCLSQTIDNPERIILDMFVSNVCNLHCKHCYFIDYKPIKRPLSIKKWYDIIDDSISVGIKHFHFSGKEPFCDKRVPLLLNRLNHLSSTYNLRYGLVTNGTLLTPKKLQELVDSSLSYIEFSLEGDKDFNLNIRGINSFDLIYNTINSLTDKSKLNITSTFFGNNFYELKNMMDMFIKIGVKKFHIAPYVKYDKDELQPLEEIDYNKMIELVNYFYHYIETIKEELIDIRISITRRQAFNLFTNKNCLSNVIDNYIYKGKKIIFKVERNVLEMKFPLLFLPYLSQLVITTDGIIIPCADDIHYKYLREISLGNIELDNLKTIIDKRKKYIQTYINQKLNK